MNENKPCPVFNCPNCGAPVTSEICAYCGSRVLPKADADVLTVQLLADGICVEELTRIVDREDRRRQAGRGI